MLPTPQAAPLLHHSLSSPLANSMSLKLGTGPFQGPEGFCPQHFLLPFSLKCPSSSYQSIIANPPSRPPEFSPFLDVFIARVTLPFCVFWFAVSVTRRRELKAQKGPRICRRKQCCEQSIPLVTSPPAITPLSLRTSTRPDTFLLIYSFFSLPFLQTYAILCTPHEHSDQ